MGETMSHDQFYKEITEAVIALDEEKALNLAKKAIKEKLVFLDPI